MQDNRDWNKDIEILKIFSDEFKDKHQNFWALYFKFIYADIFVLGTFVLSKEKFETYLINNKLLTIAIFCSIILVIGSVSTIILTKEHFILLKMGKRYTDLLKDNGYIRLPILTDEKVLPFEKMIEDKFHFSATVVGSNILIALLSIALIIIVTFFMGGLMHLPPSAN